MKKLKFYLVAFLIGCGNNIQSNMKNNEIKQYATGKKEFPQIINKINSLLNDIDNSDYQSNKKKLTKSETFDQLYKRVFDVPKISFDEKEAKNTKIETKRLYLIPIDSSFADLYHKFIFGDEQVMKTFAYGEAKDYDYSKSRTSVYGRASSS